MEPASRLATYEDLLAWPEDLKTELVDGHILVQPSGVPAHGYITSQISGDIVVSFGRSGSPHGGWIILPEVDVRFDLHNVRRPDLSGWRRERPIAAWNRLPVDVVPDWICEILSEGTERYDRSHKSALYARAGVRHYWMVDPRTRTVEAYRLHDSGKWLQLGVWDEHAVVHIEPFEALELELRNFFPPLDEGDPSASAAL